MKKICSCLILLMGLNCICNSQSLQISTPRFSFIQCECDLAGKLPKMFVLGLVECMEIVSSKRM